MTLTFFEPMQEELMRRNERDRTNWRDDGIMTFQYFKEKRDAVYRAMKDPHHPLFGTPVTDYCIRTENQTRGTPHDHVVGWCDKPAIFAGRLCATVPRLRPKPDGQPAEEPWAFQKLKEIVARTQHHQCYRLSGEPYDCRKSELPELSCTALCRMLRTTTTYRRWGEIVV